MTRARTRHARSAARSAEKIAAARDRAREALAELKKRRDLAKARLPGLRYALEVAARARAVELGLPEGTQIDASQGGEICNAIMRGIVEAVSDARWSPKHKDDKFNFKALLTEMLVQERWPEDDIARALLDKPDATHDELDDTAEKQRAKRAWSQRRRDKKTQIVAIR